MVAGGSWYRSYDERFPSRCRGRVYLVGFNHSVEDSCRSLCCSHSLMVLLVPCLICIVAGDVALVITICTFSVFVAPPAVGVAGIVSDAGAVSASCEVHRGMSGTEFCYSY